MPEELRGRATFYAWSEKIRKSRLSLRGYTAFGSDAPVKSFKNLEEFTHTPKAEGGLAISPE
jgi:hypothetical protein